MAHNGDNDPIPPEVALGCALVAVGVLLLPITLLVGLGYAAYRIVDEHSEEQKRIEARQRQEAEEARLREIEDRARADRDYRDGADFREKVEALHRLFEQVMQSHVRCARHEEGLRRSAGQATRAEIRQRYETDAQAMSHARQGLGIAIERVWSAYAITALHASVVTILRSRPELPKPEDDLRKVPPADFVRAVKDVAGFLTRLENCLQQLPSIIPLAPTFVAANSPASMAVGRELEEIRRQLLSEHASMSQKKEDLQYLVSHLATLDILGNVASLGGLDKRGQAVVSELVAALDETARVRDLVDQHMAAATLDEFDVALTHLRGLGSVVSADVRAATEVEMLLKRRANRPTSKMVR